MRAVLLGVGGEQTSVTFSFLLLLIILMPSTVVSHLASPALVKVDWCLKAVHNAVSVGRHLEEDAIQLLSC